MNGWDGIRNYCFRMFFVSFPKAKIENGGFSWRVYSVLGIGHGAAETFFLARFSNDVRLLGFIAIKFDCRTY